MISNPEQLEAFEVKPDSLKQMSNVRDSITAPFENFDLVVEALLKTACLAVEEVVGDLVEPVIECRQKRIKAFQPALFHALNPGGNGAFGRLFALLGVKDRAQLFAQIIGLAQLGRTFQQQRDGWLLLRLKIGGIPAKRPHRALEQLVFILHKSLLQFAQLPGSAGTNGATLEALDHTSFFVAGGNGLVGAVDLFDVATSALLNPTRFKLTTAEKFVNVIDQTGGVQTITDPNGNVLSFKANGITHSAGLGIVFMRDANGRITLDYRSEQQDDDIRLQRGWRFCECDRPRESHDAVHV